MQREISNNLEICDIALGVGVILNNRYRIVDYMSWGNVTIMYICNDIEKNEKVLIKELAPFSIVNRDLDGKRIVPKSKMCREKLKELKVSFDNEASILKRLSDDTYGLKGNVPDYKEYFFENGTSYLVMSYYKGIDLQKLTNTNAELNFRQIAKDLVNIVQRIHKAGILHRDIKFSNILLTEDKRVVLLDFGSSCYINNETKSIRYVSNGFSPPELYDSDSLTRWVDNFSLGAVLYQMLTGIGPIKYNSNSEMYIQDISEYVNIPWILAYAIMKLLEINPGKRLKKLQVVKMLL